MLMRTMAGSCRASGRSCPLGSANPTTHIIYQNASPYFAFHDRSRQTTSSSSRCNYSNLAPYRKRAKQMQVDNVALFGALDATYVTSAACSSEHTGRDSTRRVCIGTDHHRAEHTDDALNANLSAGTMLADCAEAIQLFMIPLYRGSRSYSD